MNYINYTIPANFTDAGKLMGLFSIGNTLEAVIVTLPLLFLCFRLLPFSVTTDLTLSLVAVVPIGGGTLIGVQDDCLGRFLSAWWRWRRRRGILTYRGTPAKTGNGR